MGKFKKKFDRVMRYICDGIPVVRPQVSVLAPSVLLQGRNALITGGTSGIGYEIAKAFLNAGANVVITGRSIDRINLACQKLKEETATSAIIKGVELDNTNVNSFHQKISEISNLLGKENHLDILVNNAGVLGGHITNATEDEYDKVLDTNLKSVFFLNKTNCRIYEG